MTDVSLMRRHLLLRLASTTYNWSRERQERGAVRVALYAYPAALTASRDPGLPWHIALNQTRPRRSLPITLSFDNTCWTGPATTSSFSTTGRCRCGLGLCSATLPGATSMATRYQQREHYACTASSQSFEGLPMNFVGGPFRSECIYWGMTSRDKAAARARIGGVGIFERQSAGAGLLPAFLKSTGPGQAKAHLVVFRV